MDPQSQELLTAWTDAEEAYRLAATPYFDGGFLEAGGRIPDPEKVLTAEALAELTRLHERIDKARAEYYASL
jgi:hypothetical protein